MGKNDRFSIIEISRSGGQDGERFDWYPGKKVGLIDNAGSLNAAGGAFACPVKTWDIGVTLRTSRTDYSGDTTPSEQVLGPRYEPQTLNGVWDDKYNFKGYAESESRRFEDMVKRGNAVKIQFQDQSFIGLITNLTIGNEMKERKTYSFTLSVHDRTDDYSPRRQPDVPRSPVEIYDDLTLDFLAMDAAQSVKPSNSLSQTTIDDVEAAAATVNTRVTTAGQTVNQQFLSNNVTSGHVTPFKRIATSFRNVQDAANTLVRAFDGYRSDTTLLYQTPLAVLNFEDWSRSTTYYMRLQMAKAIEGAKDLDRRDEPDAQGLYRPQAGESLQAISWRFYGTPHAWYLIYEANNLSSFELDGSELLIIPDRGTG